MSGWIVRLTTVLSKNLLVSVMLLFSVSVNAEEQQEQEALSEELLEFLADWETPEGEWLGPESVGLLPEPEENNVMEKDNAK